MEDATRIGRRRDTGKARVTPTDDDERFHPKGG
jgi:hypothetical protein